MSYATEQSVLNAQWNAALDAQKTSEAQRAPHVLLRPSLTVDGDMWCMLLGRNLQEGVSGFGATPAQAAEQFDWAWNNSLPPKPALIPATPRQ